MANFEILEKNRTENQFMKEKKYFKKKCSSLYIGDLTPQIEEKHVLNIFSKMYGLVSVRLCKDVISKKSLGYGYINFKNTEYAKKAIKKMNFYFDTNIFKKPIRLMWEEKNKTLRISGKGNIFINHLPDEFKTISLYKLFLSFGKILSCKICYDENGKSKKFGFVHFFSSRDAKKAIQKVNGTIIQGKMLQVCPFIKKEARDVLLPKNINYTNIYVKNLDVNKFTEENIRNMFEVFGEITSILIPVENETPKGFAFVNFSSHLDAEEAVSKMNKKKIGNSILYVSRAKKKNEKHTGSNCEYILKKNFTNNINSKMFMVIKGISEKNNLKLLIFVFLYFGSFSKSKIIQLVHKEFSFFLNIKLKRKLPIFFRKGHQTIFSKFFSKISTFSNKIYFYRSPFHEKKPFNGQTKAKTLNIRFWKNSKCFKFKYIENKSLLSNKLRYYKLKENLTYQLKRIFFFWLKYKKNYLFLNIDKFIQYFFGKCFENLIFFENKCGRKFELSNKIW